MVAAAQPVDLVVAHWNSGWGKNGYKLFYFNYL
jgi:hypothetical protein